jgi:hypothetical protein
MQGVLGWRQGVAAALSAAAIVLCAGPASAGASVAESTTFNTTASPTDPNTDFWGQSFTVPAAPPTDNFLHTLSLLGYQRDGPGAFKLYVQAVDGGGLPTGPVLFQSPQLFGPRAMGPVTVYPNLTVMPGQKYAVYTEANSATTFRYFNSSVYLDGTFLVHTTAPAWSTATADLTFRAEFSAGKGATQTTVSNCVGPLKIGVTTSCRATVTNLGTGLSTPAGDVVFDSLPSPNAVPTGSCSLAAGQCDYLFTPGSGSSGVQTVNANYFLGDATHLPSAGGTSITVNKRTSEQSATCVPASLALGQSATCSTTVADNDSGFLSAPTGNATWNTTGSGSFSPSASCGLAPQTAGTSSCAVTYTPSAVGSHVITTAYGGGADHLGTALADAGTLTVNPAPAAPAPVATAPDCTDLRSKLQRLKRKLRKAERGKRKIRKKIRRTRGELAARGC